MAQILTFPETPAARLRLQLNRCRTQRMLDKWREQFNKARASLPPDEVVAIVAQSVGAHLKISTAQQECTA